MSEEPKDSDSTAKNEDAPKSEPQVVAAKADKADDAGKAAAADKADKADKADNLGVDALARRVAALGEDDELERRAREEEEKLAERRAAAKKGKKKGSLEDAQSKKLGEIGTKRKKRREEEEEEQEVEVSRARSADDPLLDRTRQISEWASKNQKVVGYVAAALVAALVGSFLYVHFQHKNEQNASQLLAQAVSDEQGVIGEAKDDDEDGPKDPRPHFKDVGARRDSALAKYQQVSQKYAGTGAAILARLSEGSLLLDKGSADEALRAYEDVLASALAKADLEIRGRALEGKGFAQELKGQHKEALATFKELENAADVRGFKELAIYHQARVHEALGEKDKAKELLMTVRERIAKPGDHPLGYLRQMVDDRIRAIDPKAIPEPPAGLGGGPGQMSPEKMQEMIRKMQEKMGKGGLGGAP